MNWLHYFTHFFPFSFSSIIIHKDRIHHGGNKKLFKYMEGSLI